MSLQIVREIIAKMQAPSDDGSSKPPMREGDVSELILIDRESDLVTPMLTQLTYEGLIDEIFRIRNSKRTILCYCYHCYCFLNRINYYFIPPSFFILHLSCTYHEYTQIPPR